MASIRITNTFIHSTNIKYIYVSNIKYIYVSNIKYIFYTKNMHEVFVVLEILYRVSYN